MTVIATNTASLRAANASASANSALSTAMERLSTGKRINSAKDDAAGLAIASTMTASIRGMSQGIRNANDGISMAQTAEGALDEVTNMLQRIRELSVQSASGTYSDDDRTNLQTEVGKLTSQISSILTNSTFNGVKLFDGTAGTDGDVTIQVGSTSADTVTLSFGELDLSAVTGGAGTPAVPGTPGNDGPDGIAGNADDVPATPGTPAVPAGTGIDISNAADASSALDTIDAALKTVNTARASLGAGQSQLESVVNNLQSNVSNLSDARSRIEDADYSTETAALAKAQILSQASTAMLAQANQSQQTVLQLLR